MSKKNNTKNKMDMKNPPEGWQKSIQYDLYSTFVSNDATKVSNLVEFWENIPKYFFTP